jgi:hypothetical protein
MEKKYLSKFFEESIRVKLNLKNGKFYTGIIIELGENTLIFRDRFGNEIPFSLDAVAYIDFVNRGESDG